MLGHEEPQLQSMGIFWVSEARRFKKVVLETKNRNQSKFDAVGSNPMNQFGGASDSQQSKPIRLSGSEPKQAMLK